MAGRMAAGKQTAQRKLAPVRAAALVDAVGGCVGAVAAAAAAVVAAGPAVAVAVAAARPAAVVHAELAAGSEDGAAAAAGVLKL